MCIPALMGALGAGGVATAAGATAGAATGLAQLGTLLSVGGSLVQGIMAMQAANQQAQMLEDQREQEKRITAAEDQRTRQRFQFQIGQQVTELAGRGIRLDSPMAVFLGETAAREMSFESQSVRSHGAARQRELSWAAQQARARGAQAMFRGFTSAAGGFLNAAPRLWPGMLS